MLESFEIENVTNIKKGGGAIQPRMLRRSGWDINNSSIVMVFHHWHVRLKNLGMPCAVCFTENG